ncbi:unnamed protein product [Sphagnum jensenii]|uniref:Uncharacterized protein n=1 Tax=Sphagnum jensenii TaxID=128206 RepID=A0ABP1C053_9BRYO
MPPVCIHQQLKQKRPYLRFREEDRLPHQQYAYEKSDNTEWYAADNCNGDNDSGDLEDEFEEMEKERRRGGPGDNLREDDPETANPARVDVEKQRLGVGWRTVTTTGLTQERK